MLYYWDFYEFRVQNSRFIEIFNHNQGCWINHDVFYKYVVESLKSSRHWWKAKSNNKPNSLYTISDDPTAFFLQYMHKLTHKAISPFIYLYLFHRSHIHVQYMMNLIWYIDQKITRTFNKSSNFYIGKQSFCAKIKKSYVW